jgi:hypothetical protein
MQRPKLRRARVLPHVPECAKRKKLGQKIVLHNQRIVLPIDGWAIKNESRFLIETVMGVLE